MQTHVFIPATINLPVYNAARDEIKDKRIRDMKPTFIDRPHDCTIIAFIGVGTSHPDGSYNADVMAVAMRPDGRVITKKATEFTILPAADLAPEVLA